MYKTSYKDWSEYFWDKIAENSQINEESQEFLATSPDRPKEEIIRRFKIFLGKLYKKYYSRIVSPSCFLLDSSGMMPELDW